MPSSEKMTRMTQMRLTPTVRAVLEKASKEYELPINFLVQRALEKGLPQVLRLLAELYGKPGHNGNGE